jgi:hypothetical protein
VSRGGAKAQRDKKRTFATKITVVTPTIPGREEFLEEAKASVTNQTLPAVTHLVELDADHEGPGPTMNKLVRQVETEWVSILSDDDLYDPNHLEVLAAHSHNADIVLSWCRFLGGEGPKRPLGGFNLDDLRAKKFTGMTGCFMFRKSLYDKLGGWSEGVAEDWGFMTSAADAGARFVPVYQETWSYRQHDDSISTAIGQLIRGEEPNNLYHLARHI